VLRVVPTTWWRLGIWLLGIAIGLVSCVITFSDEGVGGIDTETVLVVLVGWSFMASGLVAWRRRPENRLGRLLFWLGLVWLTGQLLTEVPDAAVFTLGLLIADGWVVLFAFFLVSFPHGRLHRRSDLLLFVGPFALATMVLEVVWLLFLDLGDNPGNALLIWPHAEVANAVDWTQRVVIVAGTILLTGELLRRWWAGGPPLRRALLPVLAGAATIAIGSVSVIWDKVGGGRPRELTILLLATLVAVPLAMLFDILRARLAQSGVGDLLVEVGENPAPAHLRDALARVLRDPSLTLAYWLPEYETYADLDGHPVELCAGPGRAWTTVDRSGRRVAALCHDSSLLESPALLDAVGAAAGMALDNARLHAELQARLEELRGSRVRIIEAAQSERRRLERDLHDGAQQRLVSLSLDLGLLETRLGDDPAAKETLEKARSEVAQSLAELRELARGLHPAVVTGHGLEVALESLVARAPLPVRLTVDLDERLPEPVEVAAYYLVSESLTNMAKYARASSATVSVERAGDELVVEVADDGVGGADTDGGSGLRGLADRMEAFGGTLRVWSPPGAGTRVRGEIPCA
jgi:signal transduction histidine kinase